MRTVERRRLGPGILEREALCDDRLEPGAPARTRETVNEYHLNVVFVVELARQAVGEPVELRLLAVRGVDDAHGRPHDRGPSLRCHVRRSRPWRRG